MQFDVGRIDVSAEGLCGREKPGATLEGVSAEREHQREARSTRGLGKGWGLAFIRLLYIGFGLKVLMKFGRQLKNSYDMFEPTNWTRDVFRLATGKRSDSLRTSCWD